MMVFTSEDFGSIRTIVNNKDKIFFVAKDVAVALGYEKQDAMYRRLSERHKLKVNPQSLEKYGFPQTDVIQLEANPNIKNLMLITESGMYKAVMGSILPEAETFQDWVTDEILPSIRKTGSYILKNSNAEKIAVSKVMENADIEVLEMIQAMAKSQIKIQKELKLKEEENKKLINEVTYKENIIIGLVDDIDLTTKRQRLNQIMVYGFKNSKNQSERWRVLYNEFERKYHLNLQQRLERDNLITKPKYKNKLDYIDRKLNKIPEMYELACKIFENDVEKLKKEWFEIVKR